MFHILLALIQALQTALAPICFVTAWTLIVISLWTIWNIVHQGITHVKRLHQIPCSRCQFFTGNYTLKCVVHPTSALTEAAINCSDFCSQNTCLTSSRQLNHSVQ
jgi:hypothetical protein